MVSWPASGALASCGAPARLLETGLRRDRAAAVVVATALFTIYLANGRVSGTHDAHANACLAATFASEGRLSVSPSEGPNCLEPSCYSFGRSIRVDARSGAPLFVSIYGPGSGLTAAPIAFALRVVRGDFRGDLAAVGLAGKIAASLLCALTVALVLLTLRTWVPLPAATALAFAYGLGTTVWSASSQALWQHAPASFFLAAGIWAWIRGHGTLPSIAAAGFALAAAVTCRPTVAVFLVAVGIAASVSGWRECLTFASGAVPPIVALAIYNAQMFGSPFRFGYLDASESGRFWQTPLLEGLAGIVVSPSRGLLVYTPFLAVALWGAVAAWRSAEYAVLRPLTVGVLALLLIHAKWTYWWGGYSYGPRILGELLVPLVLLLAPMVAAMSRSPVRRNGFAALILWSVAVEAVGVATNGGEWNARVASENGVPVRMSIDDPRYRWRLWSIHDSQIASEVALLACGLRRVITHGEGTCGSGPAGGERAHGGRGAL
jgi:hypothetical protein